MANVQRRIAREEQIREATEHVEFQQHALRAAAWEDGRVKLDKTAKLRRDKQQLALDEQQRQTDLQESRRTRMQRLWDQETRE